MEFSLNPFTEFVEFRDKKIKIKNCRVGTQDLLCKRQRLYHRDNCKRADPYTWVFHDRPIWRISVRLSDRNASDRPIVKNSTEPNSCLSDFSDSLNSLNSVNSMKVPFHLEKPPMIHRFKKVNEQTLTFREIISFVVNWKYILIDHEMYQ